MLSQKRGRRREHCHKYGTQHDARMVFSNSRTEAARSQRSEKEMEIRLGAALAEQHRAYGLWLSIQLRLPEIRSSANPTTL